jgi:hypothetical protein
MKEHVYSQLLQKGPEQEYQHSCQCRKPSVSNSAMDASARWMMHPEHAFCLHADFGLEVKAAKDYQACIMYFNQETSISPPWSLPLL